MDQNEEDIIEKPTNGEIVPVEEENVNPEKQNLQK